MRKLPRGCATAVAVDAPLGLFIERASLTNERPRDDHAWPNLRRCTQEAAFDAAQAMRLIFGTKQKLGFIRVLRSWRQKLPGYSAKNHKLIHTCGNRCKAYNGEGLAKPDHEPIVQGIPAF